MNKKIILAILILIILTVLCFVIKKTLDDAGQVQNISDEKNDSIEEENSIKSNKEEDSMYSKGKHHTKIEIKNYGKIELELDADIAPITVANFAKLATSGFYNGLTFHRIIDGFMIQGGDPLGNGMGGSDEEIKGEFSANGVKNTISHKRGTISMARSSAFDSASSQFFIVHKDSVFLDGQYAGFGKVTSGIEIVDKICEDTEVVDDNGTVLKDKQPIIEKITMID